MTTISLEHTFVTGLSQFAENRFMGPTERPNRQYSTQQYPIQQSQTTSRQHTTKRPITTTVEPTKIENDFECGTTDIEGPITTLRIRGGQTASRGQFPW